MTRIAIVMDRQDNVSTALTDIDAGTAAPVEVGRDVIKVTVTQRIPFGHKFALKRIEQHEDVIKYGEVIGRATQVIEAGDHVHIHNVRSLQSEEESS